MTTRSRLVFAHPDEAQAFKGIPHLITGIGLVNATTGLARAVAHDGIDRVVVLGTAGLIDDSLDLDTVYRVSETVQHDFAFESPRAFIASDGAVRVTGKRRGSAFRATEPVEQEETSICRAEANVIIATGDAFVTDDGVKADLLTRGVHLVDMESYGYAAMCAALDVPIDIFKIPSDFADSNTTDEDWDSIVKRKSEQLLDFARDRGLV